MGILKGLLGGSRDLAQPVRITGEIYQVGGSDLTSPSDAAIYLIVFEGRSVLVDAGTGEGEDRLLENIRSVGVDPEGIDCLLLTHCHYDHTGGVASLKERMQWPVVAHELDAVFLEEGNNLVTAAMWYGASIHAFTVDRKLSGASEEIELSGRAITAVHIPGHSPGSVVYLTESEGKRVALAQDVHGPLDPNFRSNARDYQASLRRLIGLEPDILCEGHFGIFRGRETARQFVERFLADQPA